MRRIAVLAASRRELAPVRAALDVTQRGRIGSCRYRMGRAAGAEVYLIETGMGPRCALKASEEALAGLSVHAMVSTGFAGGLGSAGVGELILGTKLLDWTGEKSGTSNLADADLLESARGAAREAGVVFSEGPVVTVGEVVCLAAEKKALGKASGAIAVDMESAAIASAAACAGVPFLLARVVSDCADEDLPMDFNLWLSPWGRMRGMGRVLIRPSILRSLLRMKRQAGQGSQSLARFFQAWILTLGADRPSVPRDAVVMASGGGSRVAGFAENGLPPARMGAR